MDWLEAPDYWLARFLFERALAAIYLIAFWGTANQFPPLAAAVLALALAPGAAPVVVAYIAGTLGTMFRCRPAPPARPRAV